MNRERKGNRLRNYDYSQPGHYFVTICVHPGFKGRNVFGIINNGKMELNKNGEILNHVWQNLPNHYYNCLLDEYIIMPDHFHGIVEIITDDDNVGNGLKPFPTVKHHGLPEFIRGFKTFSSRGINAINNGNTFRWQKSYHDRIIRNDESLYHIRKYIINNPIN
jgi:REP element-mobilizing transposase RayT